MSQTQTLKQLLLESRRLHVDHYFPVSFQSIKNQIMEKTPSPRPALETALRELMGMSKQVKKQEGWINAVIEAHHPHLKAFSMQARSVSLFAEQMTWGVYLKDLASFQSFKQQIIGHDKVSLCKEKKVNASYALMIEENEVLEFQTSEEGLSCQLTIPNPASQWHQWKMMESEWKAKQEQQILTQTMGEQSLLSSSKKDMKL